MTLEQRILALLTHRENLANAKTFEEYRAAHVAFTDLLIVDLESDKNNIDAVERYIQWKYVEPTDAQPTP